MYQLCYRSGLKLSLSICGTVVRAHKVTRAAEMTVAIACKVTVAGTPEMTEMTHKITRKDELLKRQFLCKSA